MNATRNQHDATTVMAALMRAGITGSDVSATVLAYLSGPEFDRWILRIDEARDVVVETRTRDATPATTTRIGSFSRAVATGGLEAKTHIPRALANGYVCYDWLLSSLFLWDVVFAAMTRSNGADLPTSKHQIERGYRQLGEYAAALHRIPADATCANPPLAHSSAASVRSLLETPPLDSRPPGHSQLRHALQQHSGICDALIRAGEVEDSERRWVPLHGRLTAASAVLTSDSIVVLGGADAGYGHPRIDIVAPIAQLLECSIAAAVPDYWGSDFAASFIQGYGGSFEDAVGTWQALEDAVILRSAGTLLRRAAYLEDDARVGAIMDAKVEALAQQAGGWLATVRDRIARGAVGR